MLKNTITVTAAAAVGFTTTVHAESTQLRTSEPHQSQYEGVSWLSNLELLDIECKEAGISDVTRFEQGTREFADERGKCHFCFILEDAVGTLDSCESAASLAGTAIEAASKPWAELAARSFDPFVQPEWWIDSFPDYVAPRLDGIDQQNAANLVEDFCPDMAGVHNHPILVTLRDFWRKPFVDLAGVSHQGSLEFLLHYAAEPWFVDAWGQCDVDGLKSALQAYAVCSDGGDGFDCSLQISH